VLVGCSGCSGGTGRTGTILACLAIIAGVPADLAVPWVRDRYRRRAVETQAQVGWVVDRFGQADLVRKEVASSRARLVKATIDPTRQAMREALHRPERSPVLAWAVPGVLAVTQRPLRAHPLFGGSGHSYPASPPRSSPPAYLAVVPKEQDCVVQIHSTRS
jgi:hypothetical protein